MKGKSVFQFLFKLYRILVQILSLPITLSEFFDPATGRDYDAGFGKKAGLLFKMIRNNSKIVSGSTFMEHIFMATSLLKIPPSLPGVVVECGTYKGVSAANISLVCKIIGRQFEIFDSFEGLPEPSDADKEHILMSTREIHTYEKGAWCGTLDEVKQNIAKYGDISVCKFHKGYFEETLPQFSKKCVQVWVDVDYRSSLETCLKYLWPLMRDGAYFYTHEAGHMEIASLFFSEEWWQVHCQMYPPGLIGAGTGLGLKILTGPYFQSSLGYTIKHLQKQNLRYVPQTGGMRLNLSAPLKLMSHDDTRD